MIPSYAFDIIQFFVIVIIILQSYAQSSEWLNLLSNYFCFGANYVII